MVQVGNCDPCNCLEMYYRDSQSWRKAMIQLLCDIETAVENFVVNENLWDRAGTILFPHTVGDSIQVANDTYFSGLDSGGSNAGLLKIDINDNTILHSVTSKLFKFTRDSGSTLIIDCYSGYPSITGDTSDGSDNQELWISGAGGGSNVDSSRGGLIAIAGNEVGGSAGRVFISGGNVASGHINLQLAHASATIKFEGGGGIMWSFDTSGVLTQNATYGGNIKFQKTDSGIQTDAGPAWSTFGDYTAGAPGATGYITLKVGGVAYKLLAST